MKVKAFRLGEALDWAAAQAVVKGFERVTVACEPTGPRWMQVQRLCAERGLPLMAYYRLDSGAPVCAVEGFTTDSNGNGSAIFSFGGLAAGSHNIIIEINNTPAPGSTYYTTNAAGGIPFTC